MIAIVGCGISGLWFANTIKGDLGPLFFIEKSRGVGGRLATRRWDEARFDHGTQVLENVEHDASLGMTHFAKQLAEGHKIHLDKKVIRLQRDQNQWRLETEDGDSFLATTVVLSCPLPQSLDLLEKSQISFSANLKEIHYHKKVIALVKFSQKHRAIEKVIHNPHVFIESVFDQMQKGVSAAPAWTVVFNESFSEDNFEKPDEELILMSKKIMSEINIPLPSYEIQIKKWRYSRVKNPTSENFFQACSEPPLYLIGDAFAGGDLLGSQKSAEALAQLLKK